MAGIQASDSSTMPLDEPAIRSMTASIVRLLETKCIRLNGHDPGWRTLFAQQSSSLERSASAAEFEARVSEVLARGGLSHVALFHESAQRAPARYAINATFCRYEDPDEGESRWMFQDVHEGGPAQRAGVRPGDILLSVDGQVVRPPTLPTFGLSRDAVLTVRRGGGQLEQVTVILPKTEAKGKAGARPPMAEPTSVTAHTLEDDIGYLRVAFFPGVNGQRFARELDQALATLPGCTRLIVDLRGNLGGFVGSLRLMSHLTPDRISVGYSLTRVGEDRKWRPDQLPSIDKLPTTKWDMLQMAVRFMVLHRDRSIRLVTEGLGPKAYHGRVVMLINEHTLSAGEMVASFVAENGLARLVGVRTGGQVLGGGNFTVGHGFILRLPAAGWYTPSGAIVEGRGVAPDVEVRIDAGVLRSGRDTQLEAAVAAIQRM